MKKSTILTVAIVSLATVTAKADSEIKVTCPDARHLVCGTHLSKYYCHLAVGSIKWICSSPFNTDIQHSTTMHFHQLTGPKHSGAYSVNGCSYHITTPSGNKTYATFDVPRGYKCTSSNPDKPMMHCHEPPTNPHGDETH